MLKKGLEHFDNKEDKDKDKDKDMDMDLRLTNTQKRDIKQALKRGIYHELHTRNYLSDAQLNELIRRNT